MKSQLSVIFILFIFAGCVANKATEPWFTSSNEAAYVRYPIKILSTPSFNGRAIDSAKSSDILRLISTQGNWFKVETKKGNVGWVAKKWVQVDQELSIRSIEYKCSELSKNEAYKLLSQGHDCLDKDGDGHPCEWDKRPAKPIKKYSAPKNSSNCTWVKGYYRKNGTFAKGHMRCK